MDRIATRISTFAIVLVVSLLVTGCGDQEANEGLPPVLKIGVLPDESNENLTERYEPLRRHLSEYLEITSELDFSDKYK